MTFSSTKKTAHLKGTLLSVLLITLLSLPMANAYAQSASSAEAAMDIALQKNGGNGKVLGVRDKKKSNGRDYYEVKVLQNGKVRIFKIDKK